MAIMSRTVPVVVDVAESPFARQLPLPVDAVRLEDAFWAPRLRRNREVTIPTQLELLETTGRLANFRRAAGTETGRFEGFYFNDTDVYKWLEAASWALAVEPDVTLDRWVDEVIAVVGAAQQPDGYLDNYYVAGDDSLRWQELWRTHELYCAGHLFQAAVAHNRATGKTSLLTIARRFADLICDRLGPAEAGKQPGTDGHPEVEMALVELARATGKRRYLDQAAYFLDVRGQGLANGGEYRQDHKPFRELDAMVGHAVRILYLCAGAADVYAETGDETLLATLERLWRHMTRCQIYLSGGLGARHDGEAFGADFELPNDRAYTETCAAIASLMWNWRMLLLTGEARYADLFEHTLYNAFLPGLSLDGKEYFYVNPLADEGGHRRQPWYECACCPPNIARTIASLPGYVYTVSDHAIHVHQYAGSVAGLTLPDGREVGIRQETRYPCDGEIAIELNADGAFALDLRVPTWCEAGATAELNGEPVAQPLVPGTYLRLDRTWAPGDLIRLHFPMPVRRVEAHPYVLENRDHVGLMRGPLLYCVEAIDHPGVDLRDLVLSFDAPIEPRDRPDLLDGVVTLRGRALVQPPALGWDDRLYRTAEGTGADHGALPTGLTAIPYYAWANRAPGQMRVWLRRDA
jgi:uncharacterized protein